MKPKLQPIAFPVECTPYGEQAFQPLVLTEQAYAVAGGPNALFLIEMHSPPKLVLTIPARDRIAGFAVHASHLYVQDGPVLSQWNIVQQKCVSAINVLQPKQRYTGTGDVDWAALHLLPEAIKTKRDALKRARRRAEWGALLEYVEAQKARASGATAADLQRVIDDLRRLIGSGGAAGARADLARVTADAAALIISPPVVRTHQIWGKTAAMVFVIGRDSTLHPLDDKLSHMGTRKNERGAQPALALGESLTDADSDEWASRVYYVAENGTVQALDGNSLPPAPLASWQAAGEAKLDARVRPRVQEGVVWGSGALGTGIYALTVDKPTEPSLAKVPAGDWRWLEVRPENNLFLAATGREARLMSYDRNAKIADRWGKRESSRTSFLTFLPKSSAPAPSGRPLLVLELDAEIDEASAPLGYRVMIANTVDATHPAASEWYPPPPSTLFDGTFEPWGTTTAGPRFVRTQPSVSRQDVYLHARDRSSAEQVKDLLATDSAKSWAAQYAKIVAEFPDAPSRLGDIALPELGGKEAFFCYAVGNEITADQAKRAIQAISDLQASTEPIRLAIWYATPPRQGYPPAKPFALANLDVTLRFQDGTVLKTKTNGEGVAWINPAKNGQWVEMDPVYGRMKSGGRYTLDRSRPNVYTQN